MNIKKELRLKEIKPHNVHHKCKSRQVAEANGQALATLTAKLQHITTLLTPTTVTVPPVSPAPFTDALLFPDGAPEPRVGSPQHYNRDSESVVPS